MSILQKSQFDSESQVTGSRNFQERLPRIGPKSVFFQHFRRFQKYPTSVDA